MLTGYKTYICAALMVILAGLHALNYINDSVYQTLVGLVGAGGLAGLRAAVSGK